MGKKITVSRKKAKKITVSRKKAKILPSCLSALSEVYSKVESEPKHEVSTIEREFKFRKRMGFSVLASLITVPLHSTLAVNNSGLKFVS